MSDLLPGRPGGYEPSDRLAKYGVAAAGFLIGGAGLLFLGILPPIMGIAAGVLAAFVGVGGATSKNSPDDRRGGLVVAGAGIFSILARLPVTKVFAAPLMALGAVGLFAFGIWNSIKFIKGLKSRS